MILEEQIQLVLTRVRDKVSRSSIYTAKILLEIPMLRNYWNYHICHVRHILLLSRLSHLSRPSHYPPLQATSSHKLFYLSYQKLKLKILLQEVHVIFTWCGVDPDMLDSNIFGTWFCWVLTMKFVDHFGSISKISNRFPSSLAYFIALPMYKIF